MINYFSINLNYIKRINALTSEEISNVTNLSLSTVSKLINAKVDPNIDTLLQLSETFGYTIDDLLKIEIEKSNKHKEAYVNEDTESYKNGKIETLKEQLNQNTKDIVDLKYQIQQKDLVINELIKDKNVFRDQAEKYMQLLTQQNKKAI